MSWRELRCFDRARHGRVGRRSYWLTLAADAVLLALAFFLPLEILYRLQADPEAWPARAWVIGWLILLVYLLICLFRLTGRRLRDGGRDPGWRWLWLLPIVGWLWLAWLCARAAAPLGPLDRLP